MTTTPTGQPATLSDLVAEEIRAVLGRRRMSGAALARTLGVSAMWVSYRLSGKQPIDLNDLERIATALDVPVGALIPATTHTQTTVAKLSINDRPRDTRPEGRPRKGIPPLDPARPRRIGDPLAVPVIRDAA